MKIMYCITSSSWGGAQLHVLELCRDQVKRGNQVIFVVGDDGPLLSKVKRINGVTTILLSTLHKQVSPIDDLKSVLILRKIIKKESPDIVHLHSSKAGTIGRLSVIGLKNKPKTIFTVHGWAFTDGVPSKAKRKLYRMIEKLVSPLTDLFICVSEFDKRIGIRDKVLSPRSKVSVIHNGSPEPNKKDINFSCHDPLRFVMIARFAKQKDQKMLINAIKDLPKDQYLLTFVGDGETLLECKELVHTYGLGSNVKFLGFKDDVIPYLIDNDVYILSTHYEGLPISIIEAMSYGLPILASDVGGNSEMVKNGHNGFLFKSRADLERILFMLIKNRNLISKMGSQSRYIYKSEFSLVNSLKKVNDCYLELIKGK